MEIYILSKFYELLIKIIFKFENFSLFELKTSFFMINLLKIILY